MGLDVETRQRIALAAERVPGPRYVPWPMPGSMNGMVSFSTYSEWEAFFLRFELAFGIPQIVTTKFDRAVKLHLLAWIDFDILKAGELAALVTLELALKNHYGDVVKKNRWGDYSFAELLRYMVSGDDLTDEMLPIQRRCRAGSVVDRITGKAKPSYDELRNELAHGYPFDGLTNSGLLEVMHDLIEYAYREAVMAAS